MLHPFIFPKQQAKLKEEEATGTMDNKVMLWILAFFLVALASLVQGTEHIVGDYYGWTLGFNYTAWAEHKEFIVGDTLVFNYEMGKHNVYKVGGLDFLACSIPAGAQVLTTGKDVINLAMPGKKWYFCGVGKHCGLGLKLAINVQPAETWNSLAPAPAVVNDGSKTFIVGDDKGWTPNFDYNIWAKGKVFGVGDVLLFKYMQGAHNVFKVDGPNFKACTAPANAVALTTGNDMITLATPGRKWYICGVSNHCQTGQKLFIDVLPSPSKALAPSPSSPPSVAPGGKIHIVGDYSGWTLNFNYAAWAQGKEFRVGDKLVFNYPVGKHNVYKVGGPDFQTCSVPVSTNAMTTGYDVITLQTPGRKWYLCGVGNGKHCQYGMRLVIDVLPDMSQALPHHGY